MTWPAKLQKSRLKRYHVPFVYSPQRIVRRVDKRNAVPANCRNDEKQMGPWAFRRFSSCLFLGVLLGLHAR